jgi:hypothetical protein
LRGNDVLVFEHLVVTGDPRAAASAKHKTLGKFARTAREKSQRCANRMMIRNLKAIKALRQGQVPAIALVTTNAAPVPRHRDPSEAAR